jgi:hypothetical protein
MKAISDFPDPIYFNDHILPMLTDAHQAYLQTKYGEFFQLLLLPVLNRAYEKEYGKPAPATYEPTLYELLTYELLPFAPDIMETLPKPIISALVLVEVSAGEIPAGVSWDIDQIRLFARWLDSDRPEREAPKYNPDVPESHVFSHSEDDDTEHEHRHFKLRHFNHLH